MKGHPKSDKPRGALFKEINALIASVPEHASEAELVALLGEPDKRSPHLGHSNFSEVLGGPSQFFRDPDAEHYLSYRDPYRSRRTYVFGIAGGRVVYREQMSRTPGSAEQA